VTTQTLEEQTAGFITSTFKDGETSDGSPTAEEEAAAAANARPADTDGEEEHEEGEGADEQEESEHEDGEEGEEQEEKPAKDAKDETKDESKPAKKNGKSYKERIGDLTANWRSEQRRAEAAEAELARLKAGGVQKSSTAPLTDAQRDDNGGEAPPDPSQFDYGELDPKYIAALARYETTQALQAQKAKDDKDRQAQAADAKRLEQVQKQAALVKAGVKLFDDFDEVVIQGANEGTWELTHHLGELLLDSEFGPQIAYDLAKNPDEAARVAKLSPAEQAKYLGRQEAKFEAAKPSQRTAQKTPQAPIPPKLPKGGSGSNKVGADSTDFAAVERAWSSGAL